MINNRFDEYMETHPRESLQLGVMCVFLAWQSLAALIGIVIYLILRKYPIYSAWHILLLGSGIAVVAIGVGLIDFNVTLSSFIKDGFHINLSCWKYLLSRNSSVNVFPLLNYTIGFPIFVAGVLSVINLIPVNPHHAIMKALSDGSYSDSPSEIDNHELEKKLKNMSDADYDSTLLGLSKYTGKPVVIPDKDINQVLLVLGTTGSGKTITPRRFYKRAIMQGYPLIIVDGKPDDDNIAWLQKQCEQYGRQFIGFNCGNFLPYDPLANGGYTELKDKIISLKDEWSSDYYRSIAEDYLQTTFEVLLKSTNSFDLRAVVDCLNYDELVLLARASKDTYLMRRVNALEHYDRKDITGLQAHLNILLHSELGQFFEKNEKTFTFADAILKNSIVYFALPALRFPSFSKVLGKLVINDLKAVVDRNSNLNQRVFTVFDEFSVFAGEQVLNLVNMGRGKGVHAIFGTQGLADLDKIDDALKRQILNCANTLICHRLNDQESAESIASWVGTKDAFTMSAQLNTKQNDAGMGSVRRNKEFIIHPDAIKQGLQAGEAFYITKVGKFNRDKVIIRIHN